MGPSIHLNLSPPSVRIGSLHMRDQWVELYALLVMQEMDEPGVPVTVERVHRLAGWSLKKQDSVGKEIARHLATLRDQSLDHVVLAPSKTRAWRLGIPLSDVRPSPSRSALREWLSSRMLPQSGTAAWGIELTRLVQAMIALRKGRADEAGGLLRPAPNDVRDGSLMGLRALLAGRILYIEEDPGELDELDAMIVRWEKHTGAAARAVAARLRSFQVMRGRYADAASTRATLTKLAADLDLSGDAGSLGVILNVLGILERRSGDPARGFEHLCRAAALHAITGDHQNLQAALYNAAIARKSELKRLGEPPDDLSLSLLELCLIVCQEMHVGEDSALAELTRADWLLDRHALGEVEPLLRRAEHILQTIESSYDQAFFLQVRGRFLFEKGASMREVVRDMNASARIYGEVGDFRAERRATAMLKRFLKVRRS